jgi:hypothetical protein
MGHVTADLVFSLVHHRPKSRRHLMDSPLCPPCSLYAIRQLRSTESRRDARRIIMKMDRRAARRSLVWSSHGVTKELTCLYQGAFCQSVMPHSLQLDMRSCTWPLMRSYSNASLCQYLPPIRHRRTSRDPFARDSLPRAAQSCETIFSISSITASSARLGNSRHGADSLN